MTIVHLDTCGCVLTIGKDGEPDGYEGAPCAFHTGMPPSMPTAECRAKNATVARAAAILGIDIADVPWGFDDLRNAHVLDVQALDLSATAVASSGPLSRDDFVASVTDTAAGAITADVGALTVDLQPVAVLPPAP